MSGCWHLLFRRSRIFYTFVELFRRKFRVMFNSKKTMCMRIGSNDDPPARVVSLNGSPLIWTRRMKHLGNIITCDLKDSEDITFKNVAFISQVNRLNCKMSEVSGNVAGQLLQTYCCSWYGCQTWDLASKSARQMNTEWNKAVRRTLRVPYTTPTNFFCLCWSKESLLWLNISPVCQDLYNLLFVQIIPL